MPFVNYNGLICIKDEALVSFHSRALRYGEGLIETMYFNNRKIRLLDLHYNRLKTGLEILHFPSWDIYDFEKEIAKVIIANQSPEKGILRAHFFMNDALFELQFWIEYLPITGFHGQWKPEDLKIGITASFTKTPDVISQLKHSSRLLYVMAKHEATNNGLDDMLLMNPAGNIVESTISNVFVVKDKAIYTPPLSEGCVAGVMRQYLLNQKQTGGFTIKEKIIEPSFIADADEVFLTNAVRGIQPVHSINGTVYTHDVTHSVYDFISAL